MDTDEADEDACPGVKYLLEVSQTSLTSVSVITTLKPWV